MESTVTSIVAGFSSVLRTPFAYAKFACGHSGDVRLLPGIQKCCLCNEQFEYDAATMRALNGRGCSVHGVSQTSTEMARNPHVEADRVTKVGDVVECVDCDRFSAGMAALAALDWSKVSHTRFRPNDSRGSKDGIVYVYGRDESSPTGVSMLMSIESRPEVDAFLSARRGMAPLSPTEAR